jgi:hypothetical protein
VQESEAKKREISAVLTANTLREQPANTALAKLREDVYSTFLDVGASLLGVFNMSSAGVVC